MSVFLFFALLPGIAMQVDDAAPVEEPPPAEVIAPVEEPPVEEAPIEEAPVEEEEAPEPVVTRPVLPPVEAVIEAEPTEEDRALAGALNQRNRVRDVHRGFGIASWISMAGTLALGAIQIHDSYGPFAETEAQTPCANDEAILQDFCEIPWAHMISGIVTGALYYTAATMSSFFMPDPLGIEGQQTAEGERLRVHKTLRWFHLATMFLTSALGIVTANLPEDIATFEVRQALAWTHMALGSTTFILLSASAFVMF